MTKEELARYVAEAINGRGPVSDARVLPDDTHVIGVETDDGDDYFIEVSEA